MSIFDREWAETEGRDWLWEPTKKPKSQKPKSGKRRGPKSKYKTEEEKSEAYRRSYQKHNKARKEKLDKEREQLRPKREAAKRANDERRREKQRKDYASTYGAYWFYDSNKPTPVEPTAAISCDDRELCSRMEVAIASHDDWVEQMLIPIELTDSNTPSYGMMSGFGFSNVITRKIWSQKRKMEKWMRDHGETP